MPSVPELIKANDNNGLRELLNRNSELADGVTEQGISYLQLASYYRNKEAVEIIRKKKRTISLHEAAAVGDLDAVIEHLTSETGEVNSYSADGFTPLGLACYFGNRDIVKYLLANGADPNKPSSNSFKVAPLHSATAISDYDLTVLLLAHGADVNARQQSGVTPLHSAAHNGQLKIAKLLIDHGADVNAKTEDGKTPADMAFEKDYNEIGEFLKQHVVD
jgi:ankyrin repeat protein